MTRFFRECTNRSCTRGRNRQATRTCLDRTTVAGKFPNAISHAYYHYDTKTGALDLSKTESPSNYQSTYGKPAYDTALKGEVCSFIIVYVAPNAGEKGANIQTSPYYTDEGGDVPQKTKGGGGKDNYFGPEPGN
jgi:hypothetical protein